MKKVKLSFGIILALVIVFFTACQDNINQQDNDQPGRLVIKLTDAPFPIDMIDSAMVTITNVEVRKVSEGDEEGYPFYSVLDEPVRYNLLELQNGKIAELVDTEIEGGDYDLIRVYVDEASLSVTGGETYGLKVPSGSQTGVKIFMEPALHVGNGLTADVLLDMSIEKSFILKGNTKSPAGIKGFNFKPVIRAVNITTAGTIEGMVTNSDTALVKAYVLLEQVVDEDTFEITSAYTDTAGYYAMPGIPAGFYYLSATLTDFDTVANEDLEVVAGNLTVQDFTLSPLDDEEEE